MVYEKALNIYTDGSSLPAAPRRGGIGILFVTINESGDEVAENIELPGHAGATNNGWNFWPASPAYNMRQTTSGSMNLSGWSSSPTPYT
jgi:hypothetical protein